jgi:hypothetical protein
MADVELTQQPSRYGRRNLGPMDRAEFVHLVELIRDNHGCKIGRGRSNSERTHKRRVTTLSYWARLVEGVRSLDIDQVFYCAKCYKVLLWCETKPYRNDDEWQFIRELARVHQCYAILGVEPDHRIQHFDAVVLYTPPNVRELSC